MANIVQAPNWASNCGEDEYGYWVSLEIGEVMQRFRWIVAGEYLMGSPEEEADRQGDEVLHKVRLTEGFWLADTVCTQELWQLIMGQNPSKFNGKSLPVENVNWLDTKRFINRLNEHIGGNVFKLPTEAQWEYACRAGTKSAYAYGKNADSGLMNYRMNFGKTIEVKGFYKNAWGLCQMHGNVWEWCNDWYGEYDISEKAIENPTGPNSGEYRVLRGGSWANLKGHCRSSFRFKFHPEARYYYNGFRLSAGHVVHTK